MRNLLVGLALLSLFGCAQQMAEEAPLLAVDTVPAGTFPQPLLVDGIADCAKITGFDGEETCPEAGGITYVCSRVTEPFPVPPPGASTCGTFTFKGGMCRKDGKVTRFHCAAMLNLPAPTPDDPLAACKAKLPGFCWTDGSFFGQDCFADCECSVRTAGTTCVGPTWGGTPKPTPKVTPKPTASPVATQTPAPANPLKPCIDGNAAWCWTGGRFFGTECYADCVCERRLTNTVCLSGGQTPAPNPTATRTPAPTAQPAPTATPRPTATGPIACVAGKHPELVWTCVPDPTTTPSPRPSLSPKPTLSAAPAATPKPTTMPAASATPPAGLAKALAGVWFIPECTTVGAEPGQRKRWYTWPHVWSAYPKGWNKHIKDYGEPCTSTQEVWGSMVSIPYQWENPPEANIDTARTAIQSTITALRERKQQIADMKAAGVPDSKLPKMPIMLLQEGGSSGYGYFVDLGDGFYKMQNGKRVLKPAKELPEVLPAHIVWMLNEYKKEGATDFADVPYLFMWAADSFRIADNPGALSVRREPDYRGRTYPYLPTRHLASVSVGANAPPSASMKAQLTKNNPTLWPAGYDWKVNPDNPTTTVYANLDTPDAQAAKRDSTYYLLYLYALRGQHPEIKHVTPQITNCGYNMPDDSPWWTVSKLAQQFNVVMGVPAEAQIEGCSEQANVAQGKPRLAPYAHCRAYQALRAYNGGLISMWLPDVQDAVALDQQLLQCPNIAHSSTGGGLTAESILAEVGLGQ